MYNSAKKDFFKFERIRMIIYIKKQKNAQGVWLPVWREAIIKDSGKVSVKKLN